MDPSGQVALGLGSLVGALRFRGDLSGLPSGCACGPVCIGGTALLFELAVSFCFPDPLAAFWASDYTLDKAEISRNKAL